jgi:hypothetical protein
MMSAGHLAGAPGIDPAGSMVARHATFDWSAELMVAASLSGFCDCIVQGSLGCVAASKHVVSIFVECGATRTFFGLVDDAWLQLALQCALVAHMHHVTHVDVLK